MSRTHVLSTMSSPGNARWRFCRNNLEESAAQCDLTWQDALVGWLVIARSGVLYWILHEFLHRKFHHVLDISANMTFWYHIITPKYATSIQPFSVLPPSFPFRPRRCPIWLHHPRHAGWKCSCLAATVSARSRKTENHRLPGPFWGGDVRLAIFLWWPDSSSGNTCDIHSGGGAKNSIRNIIKTY